ncbi:PspC domain-containing protein [Ligilactobacillus murinus]|jgi:phage shock protein PspC (stress-responsive transcriptional regulator)|uniref:PspC domain-containing protein n=1 Tax=Ligilactobacillus murinus TaxID=1622 RepID=A0A4S2ECP4_9LACO|nr:PspC domain-containing protein [Ligilactobacillus murinus]GFI63596.1 hypothetical protein IMSAG117_01011 [Lactobacillaceae bacterium]MBF0758440.1 PspC domain-containing protein [Ligilactobacillus murinus]MBF0831440.1 PspC domain-containing protein [Ligilactobacillus murinus]NEF82205.1 PspC domain-containing protein [Ligilactobacillus murinus]NEF84451.1 PspC domain-containing protein [Ligilactobacillus murinus]
MAKTKKELTKSNDKVVSGVFGGVAEYFGWDKAITRIIGAILIIFPGNVILGLLIYFIAALVMPDQSKNTSSTRRSGDDDSVIEGEFKEK